MGNKKTFWCLNLFLTLTLFGCANLLELDRLVPQTVKENSGLPSLEIEVFDQRALIHYRAYGFTPGDTSGQTITFLMHGSLSDMKGYLDIAPQLTADTPVFMWDLRGNGLSERVPAKELSFRWMCEEIESVRRQVAPNSKIILLGYSWSGIFASLYAAQHPENLEGLILIEPPGLKGEYQAIAGSALNLLGSGYLGMTYLSEFLSPTDHEMIDFRSLAILEAGVRDFFVDIDNRPTMPVWRVGGLAVSVWESEVISGMGYEYDYTHGLGTFPHPVLFLATDHSPIGYDFQQRTNTNEFQDPRLVKIPNAGHRLIVEQPEAVTQALQDYIQEVIHD
jgi:proline iminopeptidase